MAPVADMGPSRPGRAGARVDVFRTPFPDGGRGSQDDGDATAQGVADQTRPSAGQVAQAAANFAEQAKAAAAPALKSLRT